MEAAVSGMPDARSCHTLLVSALRATRHRDLCGSDGGMGDREGKAVVVERLPRQGKDSRPEKMSGRRRRSTARRRRGPEPMLLCGVRCRVQ